MNPITVTLTPPVIIKQELVQINVSPSTQVFSASFFPFAFIATNNQTHFILASIPTFVVYLAINGTIQSQSNGDFSVSGKTIILSDPVDSGDLIAGVYV